jgi:hypothetical protein
MWKSVSPCSLVAAAGLAYWLSDLGTGVFHWSVDNYGSKDTWLVGGVIDAFQVGPVTYCLPRHRRAF